MATNIKAPSNIPKKNCIPNSIIPPIYDNQTRKSIHNQV